MRKFLAAVTAVAAVALGPTPAFAGNVAPSCYAQDYTAAVPVNTVLVGDNYYLDGVNLPHSKWVESDITKPDGTVVTEVQLDSVSGHIGRTETADMSGTYGAVLRTPASMNGPTKVYATCVWTAT